MKKMIAGTQFDIDDRSVTNRKPLTKRDLMNCKQDTTSVTKNKTLREAMRYLLQSDLTFDGDIRASLEQFGLDSTGANAVALTQLLHAIRDGSVESAKFIRDTAGESPSQKVEMNMNKPFNLVDLKACSIEELQEMIMEREKLE